MNVRGVAFLARKSAMIAEKGQAAWDEFVADYSKREPFFQQLILPITQIPARAFLGFNDALLDRFYGGDPQVYWKLGEKSAEWSFKEGPYRTLFFSSDYRRFVQDLPSVWKTYFSEGRATSRLEGKVAVVDFLEVPIRHIYFELSVMGYVKRGLELTGNTQVTWVAEHAVAKGDPDVLYRFTIG